MATTTHIPPHTVSISRPAGRFGEVQAPLILGTVARQALNALTRWSERHVQRRSLRELDSRMLRDIGLTPDVARRESRKAFWQA